MAALAEGRPPRVKGSGKVALPWEIGAGEGVRTLDILVGNEMLYH